MGCRLVFFTVFIAAAAALPTVERVKRADETVMFGNQQNLAHKSVKKSGPAPLDSKMAAKQEAVAEAAAEDPERQLPQDFLTAADEDRLEDELRTLMQEEHEAEKEKKAVKKAEKKAVKKAEKKAVKKAVKKAERPAVELDLAHAEKRAAEQHKQPEKTRKDFEANMHYLSYLINKMNPEDAFPGGPGRQLSRERRAASPFRRIRRSLSKMAAESHMAVSAQHRKKRDANLDPRQLAMLEYALSQANDGYDEPEEVEEPVYDRPLGDEPPLTPAGLARERLEDAELERLEAEEQPEPEGPPPEAERDYSLAKRVPDLESELEGPPQLAPELVEPEPEPEVEEEEEAAEPVSVYNSEYGPLVYSMVEHNGVRGLFVPLDQPSMAQLAAAEEEDRQREKQRLSVLGALLSLNQKKK